MNGAESLVQTLVNCNVTVCFGNPGTSEMHFLGALDANPGIRCVLCLFEGVASAAADGYARMSGRPAATLLHLGPGLANAGANLHNAMRACSPVVNVVGDHATYHRHLDAALTSDIEGLARHWSVWVKSSPDARSVAEDAAEAVFRASEGAGGIATLILPADTAWDLAAAAAPARPAPAPKPVANEVVDRVAAVLSAGEPALILAGHPALRDARAMEAIDRIAQATGAAVLAETANARIDRGAGRVAVEHLPYPVDAAVARLAGFRHCVLVGSSPPVGFFAYPGKPGKLLPPDCEIHVLSRRDEACLGALDALADKAGAASLMARHVAPAARRPLPKGTLTSSAIGAALANRLPAGAIVCDESMTLGEAIYEATHDASPHSWLELTGGAIGIGLPLAVGAAVACPERRVVVLQADGSGLYTNQALWTHAREKLDIVSIILANRAYAVLRHELHNVGVCNPGRKALDMTSLSDPDIDWCSLAKGMGVPAGVAATVEEFDALLARAMEGRGPFLIEALVDC